MICEACRKRRHGECRGGTWCDCQHKPCVKGHPENHPETHGEHRATEAGSGGDESEPGINWLRQG